MPETITEWPRALLASDVVAAFEIPGDPISKKRPRAGIGPAGSIRVYARKKDKQAQNAIGYLIASRSLLRSPIADLAFGVRARFFYTKKFDIDNTLKFIMDAATGVIWRDDVQVTEGHHEKIRVTPGLERTDVLIYRVGPWPPALRTECRRPSALEASVAASASSAPASDVSARSAH